MTIGLYSFDRMSDLWPRRTRGVSAEPRRKMEMITDYVTLMCRLQREEIRQHRQDAQAV